MITLRPLQDDDRDRLFRWRRDPVVDRSMSGPPPTEAEEHVGWFANFRADSNQEGWIIARDGAPVGLMRLIGVQSPHRRLEWVWYIGEPDEQRRGAGRAAQVLGLDRAFGGLGVRKVFGEVMADNEPALKAMSAAGFRREGYLRKHVLKDGVARDVVLMSILDDEWRERRDSVRKGLVEARLIAA